MPAIHDWHRLMASVGIHGPLTRTSEHFEQQDSAFLKLPIEIRSAVYEELLSESRSPIILRTTSGHLCIDLRRPRAFSRLLSVCKQVYHEAILVPFEHQPFPLVFPNEATHVDPRFRIPHDEVVGNLVLRMPRHLNVNLSLERAAGLTVQLTRLRLVLEARREASFVTSVSLLLDKLPDSRKSAVIKSLSAFCRGHNALIRLYGAEGLLEAGDDEELAAMMAQLDRFVLRGSLGLQDIG